MAAYATGSAPRAEVTRIRAGVPVHDRHARYGGREAAQPAHRREDPLRARLMPG